MSSILKVFLLLAVVVCASEAQRDDGQRCLCQRVRDGIGSKSEIKDIQIYQATIFCDKVEIVVTTNMGRYCLNPKQNVVRRLLKNIMKKTKTSTTVKPKAFTSTAGSSTTADM